MIVLHEDPTVDSPYLKCIVSAVTVSEVRGTAQVPTNGTAAEGTTPTCCTTLGFYIPTAFEPAAPQVVHTYYWVPRRAVRSLPADNTAFSAQDTAKPYDQLRFRSQEDCDLS